MRYTIVTCCLALIAAPLFPQQILPGKIIDPIACAADATQSYALYLPSAYVPTKRWPALLIFDPASRGTFAAEIFREAAERHGWIVLSSNNTRSGGTWESNIKTINAMWPELQGKYAVDGRRIYVAGFSGGVMMGALLGMESKGIAGIIGTGGRYDPELPPEKFDFAWFGAAGTVDFNNADMRKIDSILSATRTPHRFETFEGAHQWMPPELAFVGVEWMEVLAMKQGKREKDSAFLARLFREDLARADAFESGGSPLEAMRLLTTIASTFEGLLDVQAVQARAQALSRGAAVKKALKEEKKWDGYATNAIARFPPILQQMRNQEEPLLLTQARLELRIPELKKRAQADGMEGLTARRILEALAAHLSFAIVPDLLRSGRHVEALPFLLLSTEIRETSPMSWYNLAAVHARLKNEKKALEALDRAVKQGFHDASQLRSDKDFGALRENETFLALLKRIE